MENRDIGLFIIVLVIIILYHTDVYLEGFTK